MPGTRLPVPDLSMAAMPGEMLAPKDGHGNECPDTLLIVTCYEAPVIRILPDGKPGTRGAPRGHDLGIGPRFGPDPFEEIEYEGVNGVRQRGLASGVECAEVLGA